MPFHHDSNFPFILLCPSPPRLVHTLTQYRPTPIPRVAGTTATSIPLILCMSGSVQAVSFVLVGLASSLANAIGGLRLDSVLVPCSSCAQLSSLPFSFTASPSIFCASLSLFLILLSCHRPTRRHVDSVRYSSGWPLEGTMCIKGI